MKSIAKIGGLFLVGAIFFTATILAVIFAQGSTVRDDGSITQTSIININSIPTDVSVYVDDKNVALTDRKVEWVEPGNRKLKLSKEGYRDWQKDVVVEAGIVESIYAQLFPTKINSTQITENNIDQVIFSDNSEFAYYTVVNSVDTTKNGLWRLKLTPNFLDLGNNSPILVSSLTTQIESLKINPYSLIVSSDNNRLILQVPATKSLIMIELNRQDQSSDLVSLLGFYPEVVSWFRGSESLVVEKSNLLFEYELSTGQKSLVDFSFDNKLIYSVNNNYVMYLNSQNKKLYIYSNKLSLPVEDEILDLDLTSLVNFYTVMGSPDTIILKFADHITYINIEKEFKEDILNIESLKSMSEDGRVVLFVRDGSLTSYIIEDTPDKKTLTSKEYLIDIDPATVNTTYFTSSNRSMILRVVSETNLTSIVAIDPDGGNKYVLVESELIDRENTYIVSNDSSKLYLGQNVVGSDSILLNNLFELKLVVN